MLIQITLRGELIATVDTKKLNQRLRKGLLEKGIKNHIADACAPIRDTEERKRCMQRLAREIQGE